MELETLINERKGILTLLYRFYCSIEYLDENIQVRDAARNRALQRFEVKANEIIEIGVLTFHPEPENIYRDSLTQHVDNLIENGEDE